MKSYILTITVTIVLSAFATYMSPKDWAKYIRLICGLVIITSLIMPIMSLLKTDFGLHLNDNIEVSEYENLYPELVLDDLEGRICEDIKTRVKREFGYDIDVSVSLLVNDNNEIEKVEQIRIIRGHINDAIRQRLYEIYGAQVIE